MWIATQLTEFSWAVPANCLNLVDFQKRDFLLFLTVPHTPPSGRCRNKKNFMRLKEQLRVEAKGGAQVSGSTVSKVQGLERWLAGWLAG